jgi:hypothetical protein
MRPGGQLTGDGLASLPDVPNAHLLAEGFASYELAGVGCASVLASDATHGPNCAAPNPACRELPRTCPISPP